jgi:activator of HSP90 ATPase
MSAQSIRLTCVLSVQPARLYRAWLDSKQHSAFTGGRAVVEPVVGGKLSAWDGYITGETLELEPSRCVVQSWRTAELPPDSPSSRVEVLFEPAARGTRLTLVHTRIPAGQAAYYRKGWEELYFRPMRAHFAKAASASAKPAAEKTVKVAEGRANVRTTTAATRSGGARPAKRSRKR